MSIGVRTTWNGKTRTLTVFLAVMLALVFGYATRAYAVPGDLDPSFDGDGKLTTDFSNNFDRTFDIAVQEDGKIVAAGDATTSSGQDFALVRYNADGTLDTSFGTGGKVTTSVAPGLGYNLARAVALQPDGKIVAVGNAFNGTNSDDFAVARYNPNGSLDTTFSGDGMVLTAVGSGADVPNDVALQGNKVVVAGYTANGSRNDFALVRYDSNGNLDSTFGTSGVVKTDFFADNDAAQALAVEPDGKIVLAGYTSNPNNIAASNDFALARYEVNGSLDTTFGSGGKMVTHFGSDIAHDLTIQPDGKIVAAGYAFSGSQYDFALARYNTNGSLDGEFDFDGRVMTDFGGADDLALGLALQDDDRIIAAGTSGGDFALARFNPDGSLNNSFNHDGKLKTDFGIRDDTVNALAIQEDGKIVAAGTAYNGASTYDVALARYFGGNDANPPRVKSPEQTLVASSTLGTSGIVAKLSWSATDAEGEISSYQLQQSKDGSAYQDVALPSATATSIQPSLAFDSNYRFRVRATDDNGNQSFWKYGPRFVVDDRQENESGVSYPAGIWKTQDLSGAHGGLVKYATAKGATAKFTFTGRSVAWVAPMSSTRGKANVYLDGVRVTTVDLYSRSTLSRQVVFRRDGLDPAVNHTLEVVAMGTSGRPRVDVDAFVALR